MDGYFVGSCQRQRRYGHHQKCCAHYSVYKHTIKESVNANREHRKRVLQCQTGRGAYSISTTSNLHVRVRAAMNLKLPSQGKFYGSRSPRLLMDALAR